MGLGQKKRKERIRTQWGDVTFKEGKCTAKGEKVLNNINESLWPPSPRSLRVLPGPRAEPAGWGHRDHSAWQQNGGPNEETAQSPRARPTRAPAPRRDRLNDLGWSHLQHKVFLFSSDFLQGIYGPLTALGPH